MTSSKEEPFQYNFKLQDVVDEGKISWEEITAIEEWTQSINVRMRQERIAFFIISCDRDLDFTKETITKFTAIQSSVTQLFKNRNVSIQPELKSQLEIVHFCVLPQRTDDGHLIILHKLRNFTFYKYNMEYSMKLLFMTCEAAALDYPPTGLICIGDMEGIGLLHLTRIKFSLLKPFFGFLQDCLPLKLKEIHILNCVTFIDKILTIVKPFMKKEVFDLVNFHPKDMDYDEFYEKYLPKKCLPSDYGGSLPSIEEMHQENSEKLEDLQFYFEAEDAERS